jgi:hypothetical protein
MKHRDRTHPGIIMYGLYLYFNSRSYRLASKSLEPLKKRTHVAIWKWVQKYASFQDRFRVKKNMIKEIFVDETL